MALETGTYISDLVITNPTTTDAKSQGDDHLRLLKSCIKASFPNITGAVTATHTEVNFIDGVTAPIQPQIDAKAPSASPTFTGVPIAPTAAVGNSTAQIATTAFVANTAFSSALPAQTGNNGKFVTTNGTTASFAQAGFVLAPFSGGTLLGNVINGFLGSASYNLPDLTTATSSFGLFALTNATSVPTTVTTSDGWTVATGFVAGTLSLIAPFSIATAHGMWGNKTMTPPTLATYTGSGAPTIRGSVMMPSGILVVFFDNATDFLAVAFDTVNNTVGAAATVLAANIPSLVTCFQDTASTLVVGFKQPTGTTARICALSLSGTTLTAGSVLQWSASAPDTPIVRLQAGSYLGSSGAALYAMSVSGTACSVGTSVASGLISTGVQGLLPVTSTTALISGFQSGASPLAASSRVVTVSGTVVTVGTMATAASALLNSTQANSGLVAFDASNFLHYAKDNATGTTTDFYAVNVSGTTCSYGVVTQATNNNPTTYVPVTFDYKPGQQVINYSATQILFGNLVGPYVVTLSGTTIAVGGVQLSQTAGTFLRDYAAANWFYVGSSNFDRFTVSGATITSAEQVAALPTVFFSATVNNKTNKYGGSWYAWTTTLTMPASATKAITISTNNLLLQGAIS